MYTNHGNLFNNGCALPITIIDNDRELRKTLSNINSVIIIICTGLYFNFSASEVVAAEGGINSSISITKTGLNEPTVNFRVTLNRSIDES